MLTPEQEAVLNTITGKKKGEVLRGLMERAAELLDRRDQSSDGASRF